MRRFRQSTIQSIHSQLREFYHRSEDGTSPSYLERITMGHTNAHTHTRAITHTHPHTHTSTNTHTTQTHRAHRPTNTHLRTQTHTDTDPQQHTHAHKHTQAHTHRHTNNGQLRYTTDCVECDLSRGTIDVV